MVKIFAKDATTFTGNGLCVLDPSVCDVSETAGGEYELYIEHPIDPYGKYSMLAEQMIVEAPTPYTVIPAITLPETEILEVNTDEAVFYKKLPVYKKNTEASKIEKIRENSTPYNWSASRAYNTGSYCVYSSNIWKAKSYSYANTPYVGSLFWAFIAPLDGSGMSPTYTPGVPYSPGLDEHDVVTKIGDYSAEYYQIRDALGRIGYILKTSVDIKTTEAEEIPQQTITSQLFRIYKVESSEDSDLIIAYARHISYDFMGNRIMDCKMTDAEPANALALMQGNLMNEDTRRIACQFKSTSNKSYKISKDWSFKNPINALLDPDDGIVKELDAMLIRNNGDFFILKNDTPRTGITIEYGANMLGITWSRSTDGVVTRVVPRCSDGSDGYLYLEHGGTWSDVAMTTWVQNNEIYVDSAIASQFAYPIIEVLDCDFSVGEKYTPTGSSTEITMTEADCRTEMLKKAKKRFTDDKADGLDIMLTVEFLLVGDSEQYKQYRGLQHVNLYDKVTIKSRLTSSTAQVTKYEYDCLRGRYKSITVGTVLSFSRRVPGYRVVKEAISYEKLSPDIINRIRTLNGTVGSSDGASSSAPESGTGLTTAIDMNSKDNDGLVKKGSGQAGKVWKTDADGNPDWRDEGVVSVTDGDPTLSWGTRSKVGTVGSTDLHVTMPSNPASASDNNPTLAWGSQSKVGTTNGVDLHVTMPSNPDTWRPVVDNLTSSDTDKSLSANQGKVMKGLIDTVTTGTPTKITDTGGDVTTLGDRAAIRTKAGVVYVYVSITTARAIAANEAIMGGVPSQGTKFPIAFSGGYRGFIDGTQVKTSVAIPTGTVVVGFVAFPQ